MFHPRVLPCVFLIAFVAFLVAACTGLAFGAEPEAAQPVADAPAASGAVMAALGLLWQLLNSNFGISVVVAVALWVLKKNPRWMEFYGAHKGRFIEAVRYAEKQLPDQGATRKADLALKYLLKLLDEADAKVSLKQRLTVNTDDLRKGLEAAHKQVNGT